MKKIIIIVSALMLLTPMLASAQDSDCHEAYNAYLDHKISCCLNKTSMLRNSRSDHLRQHVAVSLQKASYIISAKSSILADLNRKKGCLKDYQIEVYLNDRFSRLCKANLSAAK
jgi:hypothetical protein